MCRGEARASQVTGSSSSCVLWSNTPPDTFPSSPVCRRGALLPSMESSTLGIREDIGFGAAVPRPARSSAYASPAVSPRPAQGWLPAWAGSPLAGQDSHLLDDTQSFMKASHPPIPFDPQGLVALEFQSFHVYNYVTLLWGCLRQRVGSRHPVVLPVHPPEAFCLIGQGVLNRDKCPQIFA